MQCSAVQCSVEQSIAVELRQQEKGEECVHGGERERIVRWTVTVTVTVWSY